jgi:hypothetical protein
MGKLQSMDLWQSAATKKACSKCGMTNKKGCCEEKQQVVKLEKKYNIPVAGFSVNKITTHTASYYAVDQLLVKSGKLVNYSSSNSPPDKGDFPLFIRNRVLLI